MQLPVVHRDTSVISRLVLTNKLLLQAGLVTPAKWAFLIWLL
jgi:hypothetical protein